MTRLVSLHDPTPARLKGTSGLVEFVYAAQALDTRTASSSTIPVARFDSDADHRCRD